MATANTELIQATRFTSGKPESILAGVWRQIQRDLNVDQAMLLERVTMYCENLSHIPAKRRAQIRGNMRTDVFKDNLTWYTFTKNLRVLNFREIEIVFDCQHLRRTSQHVLRYTLTDDFVEKKGDGEEVESPLSDFFAEMMFNLGVDYPMFEMLLELYMRKVRQSMQNSGAPEQTKNDLRAYVRKEFKSSKMSWATLIKGFNFLYILEVHMTVIITHGFDHKTRHQYHFRLGEVEDFSMEKENGTGL